MNVKIMAVTLLTITLCNCKKESTNNNSSTAVYGCKDPASTNYNPSATVDDGSCVYRGKAIFWYNADGDNAIVTIAATSGNLTGAVDGDYYYTAAPACGAPYCANFTLPVGTYTYTATSSSNNWSGTISITKNGCTATLLR